MIGGCGRFRWLVAVYFVFAVVSMLLVPLCGECDCVV